jgi:hypothetical protein
MRNLNIHKAYNLFNLDGAVFINLVSGEVNPDYGYMVFLRENKQEVDGVDFNSVIEFTHKFKSKLSKGNRFLSISKEDKCVFNICEVYHDFDDALFIAKLRKQNIWDNQRNEEVSV